MSQTGGPRIMRSLCAFALCLFMFSAGAFAADVVGPAAVTGLNAVQSGTAPNDIELSWDAVTTDAAGQPETVSSYNVYRGLTPDFKPDKSGWSNRIGTASDTSFTDIGAHNDGVDYFYLVSAVDSNNNEGLTRPSTVSTPPVLSGSWTDTTIELNWTHAEPQANVTGYRVYYGKAPGGYDSVDDVGLATSHSLSGLDLWVNYYMAVTAVDADGNESMFSNEHADAVAGRVRVQAHDAHQLCWGAAKCPAGPGEVQRKDGWQLMVPAEFPDGDWKRVLVTFTLDSRLCNPPAGSNTTKCGSGNPCLTPPCNGGYNTCGDPWDRAAHLFLVLDETCIDDGSSCANNVNLELMNAVTPFGTDAPPPDGTGNIPPRELTLDITPYAPLLNGTKYVGAEIGHYVQAGWHVSALFEFSKRDDEISPKPPADGIQVLFWGGAHPPTATLSVPSNASEIYTRLFTTGHGGGKHCTGGSNDGTACSDHSECPGGQCQPCDEFCQRTNQIIVDGTPVWEEIPWRTDCSPGLTGCTQWNACGFPSCTYSRAGWCPGYISCHHNAPCDQDLDMSSHLLPGGTYDIDYNVTPLNGSWSISLVAYWYED